MVRDERGGIIGLLDILDAHGYAVEADLRRYYGVDILDFWRGDITARQMLVYMQHLPHDSRTVALISEKPELQDWSLSNFLAGVIVDRLGVLSYMYEASHAENDAARKRIPLPESVLPDSAIEKTVREETKAMSVNEFFSPASMFAQVAQQKQQQ